MADTQVMVLGAGVIGLTTALQLLRAGHKNVTVLAKFLPSDRDPMYTSPWAGAIFVPESEENTKEQKWELASWNEILEFSKKHKDAGIWMQDKSSFYREDDYPKASVNDWWKEIVEDYQFLPGSETPENTDWGLKYRTLVLDPDTYLHFLQKQCTELGAQFIQRDVQHIRDAFTPRPDTPIRADIVINCTGLGARFLDGVKDEKVYPVRGQIVLVENPSNGNFFIPYNDHLGMDKTLGEVSYVLERPDGRGTALGGTYARVAVEDLQSPPDKVVAEKIMKNALITCPGLVPKDSGVEALRVIQNQVGFRPCREGGARVELEDIPDDEFGSLKVVHNYGAGGLGYQQSFGFANEVVAIVKSVNL